MTLACIKTVQRTPSFRFVIVAATALLTLQSVGCTPSDPAASQADADRRAVSKEQKAKEKEAKSPNNLSAPDAWAKLERDARASENRGKWMRFGGAGAINSLMPDYEKRKAEADRQANMAMQSDLPSKAIDAMVDEVANNLTGELANIPSVKAAPSRVYLAFGTINNSDRMIAALDSMKEKLFNNPLVSDSFIIVNSSEGDANSAIKAVAGGDTSIFRDPFQREVDTTKASVLEPKFIYFVSGNIYDSKDLMSHSVSVQMKWSVEHLQTRRTEKLLTFKKTFMWHPYRNEWELQP